jgi:DnaD/phage-associated family protein
MPRKRQIDPCIWTSEQFISLTNPYARLMYIGMISNADDEGRMKASPQYLKTTIFAGDSCTIPELLQWRSLIVSIGLINLYEIDGVEYLSLPTWHTYQYISKPYPSKLPAPPKHTKSKRNTDNIPAPITEDSENNPALQHSIGIGIGIGNGIGNGDSATDNIFKLFEDNYQKLNQGIRDRLDDFIKTYSEEKVLHAINEGIKYNKRSLAYIEAILKDKGNGNKPKTQPHQGTPYEDINKVLDEKGW